MNSLEKQIWILKKNAELLESQITHKLANKLISDHLCGISLPSNFLIPKASLDAKVGCRVIIDTFICRDKSYDDILEMGGIFITSKHIEASKTFKCGYCVANVTYRAKLPDDIRSLLIATGNITIKYDTYESVHCSI